MAFTWEIIKGTLPSGLTLDSVTGIVSGTPTEELVYSSVTVRVSDGFSSFERELFFGSAPNAKPYTEGTLLDWYDPYGLLNIPNGQAISSWPDYGLRNQDVQQVIPSLRPYVELTENNLPIVRSLSNDYLISNGTVNHQSYNKTTLVVWINVNVDNPNSRFMGLSAANSFDDSFGTIGQSASWFDGVFFRFFKGSPVTNQTVNFNSDNFDTGGWYFFSVVLNPDDSQGYKIRCYRDNGAAGENVVVLEGFSTNLNEATSTEAQFISLLAAFDSTSIIKNYFNGYVAGAYIYGNALTLQQLQELRDNTNPQTRKTNFNVFTWETSGAGDTKVINLNGTARRIEWGDGTYVDGFLNHSISHTYNTRDFYNVTVYPWDEYFLGLDLRNQNVQRWLYIPEYSTNMDLRSNSLDVYQVSNILQQVNNYAATYNIQNGTLRLENQSPEAIPNASGQIAWYDLVNQYNWNVTADGASPTLELFSFSINASQNQTIYIELSGYVGRIDWGDGTINYITAECLNQEFDHTYQQNYTNITISVIGIIKKFYQIDELGILTINSVGNSLEYLSISSSAIQNFNFTLPNLLSLFLGSCMISSFNFQQFPNLNYLYIIDNPLNSLTFGEFNLLKQVDFTACSLNQSDVDSLLIGLSNSNQIEIISLQRISGTNASPSSTGIIAANNIACRGKTVLIWDGTQDITVTCPYTTTTTTPIPPPTTTPIPGPCMTVTNSTLISYDLNCDSSNFSTQQIGPSGSPVIATLTYTINSNATINYYVNRIAIQNYQQVEILKNGNVIQTITEWFTYGSFNVLSTDNFGIRITARENSSIQPNGVNGYFVSVLPTTTTTTTPVPSIIVRNNTNWNYTQTSQKTIQISNQAVSGNNATFTVGLSYAGTLYYQLFNNSQFPNYITLYLNGTQIGDAVEPNSSVISSIGIQENDGFQIIGNTIDGSSIAANTLTGTLSSLPINSFSLTSNLNKTIAIENSSQIPSNHELLNEIYLKFKAKSESNLNTISLKVNLFDNKDANLLILYFSTDRKTWEKSIGKKIDDLTFEFDISKLNIQQNSINILGIKTSPKNNQKVLIYTNQVDSFVGEWEYFGCENIQQGNPIFKLFVEGNLNG